MAQKECLSTHYLPVDRCETEHNETLRQDFPLQKMQNYSKSTNSLCFAVHCRPAVSDAWVLSWCSDGDLLNALNMVL